jgi:hypothetical protein
VEWFLGVAHTVSIERTLYLCQQGCPWQQHTAIQRSRMAVRNIRTIILLEPPLQDPQTVLPVKQKSTVEVAKSTIQCIVVAAVLENGQLGISECIILYFLRRNEHVSGLPDPIHRSFTDITRKSGWWHVCLHEGILSVSRPPFG